MQRRRDGHVIGKAQRQVVARAGLQKRDPRAKSEDESTEPGVIARPRLDRCGRIGGLCRIGRPCRIGPGRRRPQRERHQNGELTETRPQRWLCVIETRLQRTATTEQHG
jgi:hypothetical protein